LLGQRRFWPFFCTQFLGAANDNLFKFALTVLVTYQWHVRWLEPQMAGLVIGAVFILPFVLFSATAGQWADKFDKTRLMRGIKAMEVLIMALAAWGFWREQVGVLLACIFLMGLHSTLFGPAKYAYLPQHLRERELTGGNGLVEMGTFVAILLGNVVGGLLMTMPQAGPEAVSVACLGLALLGSASSWLIPPSPAAEPHLQINWNPFSETWRNLRLAARYPSVFRSLLAISWMWFFGAVFLSQFPLFAHDVIRGNEAVASLLLVIFSMGVAAGSLCCERLSHGLVEIGLMPLGALGMSVFAFDLYLASRGLGGAATLWTLPEFVQQSAHWRLMVDLFLLAFSAGIYSVPMYALVQLRSQASHRARIIAANNILNALFMVVSSVAAGALLGGGWSVPAVFGATAVLNLIVVALVCWRMPEYLARLTGWVAARVLCRLRVSAPGGASVPAEGAVALRVHGGGCWGPLLVGALTSRPMIFVLPPGLPDQPGWLPALRFRERLVWPATGGPAREQAGRRLTQAMADGQVLCLVGWDLQAHQGGADELFAELLQAGEGQTPVSARVIQLHKSAGSRPTDMEVLEPPVPMTLSTLQDASWKVC